MNYLLVAAEEGFSLGNFDSITPEDQMIFLIPLEGDKLAAEFEKNLSALVKQAEHLQSQMQSKGVNSKLIIEWGAREEIISACLAREQAIPLK